MTAEFCRTGIRVVYDGTEVDRTLPARRVTLNDLLRSRLTELHPSGFLMRRPAVLDGIGLVSEEIPGSYAEDYEFLLRAARRTPIRNVPNVGVLVRWHHSSFFTRRWQTIGEALGPVGRAVSAGGLPRERSGTRLTGCRRTAAVLPERREPCRAVTGGRCVVPGRSPGRSAICEP